MCMSVYVTVAVTESDYGVHLDLRERFAIEWGALNQTGCGRFQQRDAMHTTRDLCVEQPQRTNTHTQNAQGFVGSFVDGVCTCVCVYV